MPCLTRQVHNSRFEAPESGQPLRDGDGAKKKKKNKGGGALSAAVMSEVMETGYVEKEDDNDDDDAEPGAGGKTKQPAKKGNAAVRILKSVSHVGAQPEVAMVGRKPGGPGGPGDPGGGRPGMPPPLRRQNASRFRVKTNIKRQGPVHMIEQARSALSSAALGLRSPASLLPLCSPPLCHFRSVPITC